MKARRNLLTERKCTNCGKTFVGSSQRAHGDCPRCVEIRRVNRQDGVAQLQSARSLEMLDDMVADECRMPWERRYNRKA